MSPDRTRHLAARFSAARIAMLALSIATSAASLTATNASANDLVVVYDQAQLLRLPRPPAEIIIGNASIADVSIQGGNILVVTGKTFGVTNIIALDSERNVIQDQRILVRRDEKRTVNLHKAAMRQSYSCTPNCSPMLTIGDDANYFDMVSKHNSTKTKFSESAGDSGGGGQ
jgi:Flp pilus assembly secretin CpaC